MIDKIDISQHLGRARTAGPDKQSGGDAAGGTSRPGNASQVEQLSLTDQASRLQGIEQKLADMPMTDASKVQAARVAIAEGSYAVDPLAIANKLIDFESALYGNA